MLVAVLCAGFTSAWGDEVTDVINRDVTSSLIGSTGSTAWTDITVTCTSGAEYVIHTMGVSNTPSYGIRWNKNGYLYATKSGGKVKSITITGDSKKVDIYASNSSYSAKATATKVGSLTISSEGATYTFGSEQDYTFVAINGTTTSTNISSIQITWETASSASPSIDASDVNIAYDATSGSLAYTINNPSSESLTASTTSDWLTLGTVGASPIAFTCSANPGKTSRTATVKLTYGSVTKNVTVTQAGNPNIVDNISDINAAGTYNVRGTIVAKSQRGFIVGDGTGYVYYYNNDYTQADYNIGDKVQLSGSVVVYGGVFEFNNSTTITAATESNYVAEEPTVLTGAQMDTRVGSTTPTQLSSYVQYEGVLSVSVTDNGTYYNITNIDGASTAKGSISYPLTTDFASLNGKLVKVTGYYVGVSSSQYYNTMIGSIEEVVSTTPIINLTSEAEIELAYDATSGSIEYSITNPTDDVNLTATTTASWISNITVGADAVTFTTEANEGTTDRTATITLSYTGAQTVEVTVTQKHFVADYATLPFEFNGGKADIANTAGLTQSGLDDDYSSAPKLKFDGTDDELVLKFNERPGTLTFDIKGNSFSGGTFKVQTSADGETYTDLKTYTEITDTQNESFSNLGADVRYIKWIYTNKSSGNVGLGNIELAQYSDTPTQTTITAGNLNHVTISTLYDGDMEDITLGDNVAEGTLVYFTLSVDNGFNLESESVKVLDANNDEVELTENQGSWSFTMPNSSVTINATATSSVTPVAGDKYVKVTSTSDLTSGQYLIVCEEESVAFNGGLTSLDAASNTIEVVLNNNEIAVTNATAAAEFTIDVTEGTIKSASGLYIGQTSNANGLAASAETAYTNALSLDEDGNADILSSGGSYLRYNATSGQDRFRYFKSSTYTSQKAIQLYKKVEAEQPITVTVRDAGYTTYVTPAAVSFPVGVEAFIVTAINEGSMHMDAVTSVPANTPIVVKAAEGTYTLTKIESATVNGNLLLASDGTTSGDGSTIYALGVGKTGDEAGVVGFYKVKSGSKVPAGKAYIVVSSSNPVKNYIAFDFGGTDAINAIDNGQLTVDSSVIYNVAGQRVGKMTKGIYVVNGKKVIVK